MFKHCHVVTRFSVRVQSVAFDARIMFSIYTKGVLGESRLCLDCFQNVVARVVWIGLGFFRRIIPTVEFI